MKDVDVDDVGVVKWGKVNEYLMMVFGLIEVLKILNDLNKSLEEMKVKMLSFAKESRKTFNKYLVDIVRKVKMEVVDDDEEILIVVDECVVVFDELVFIEFLIAWSENKVAKSFVKIFDLFFMIKCGDDILFLDLKGFLW